MPIRKYAERYQRFVALILQMLSLVCILVSLFYLKNTTFSKKNIPCREHSQQTRDGKVTSCIVRKVSYSMMIEFFVHGWWFLVLGICGVNTISYLRVTLPEIAQEKQGRYEQTFQRWIPLHGLNSSTRNVG